MFPNRESAGIMLARELQVYKGASDTLVLGLPRGGVVTAAAVARELDLPLDVFVVQKLRAPDDPEAALGAVTETGSVYLQPYAKEPAALPPGYLENELHRQKMEAEWRKLLFRGGRPLPSLTGRTVIVVDDGVATGSALFATLESLRALNPKRLVAASPVAPLEAALALEQHADEFVVLEAPGLLSSVGAFYGDFTQVSDAAVLERLCLRHGASGPRRHLHVEPATN